MDSLLKQRDVWRLGQEKLQNWHAQSNEPALEPELEIVDPHHHFWDYRQLMGHNLFEIFKQQYYMTDELMDDIVGSGHNVTHAVYVDAHAFHDKTVSDETMAPLGKVVSHKG